MGQFIAYPDEPSLLLQSLDPIQNTLFTDMFAIIIKLLFEKLCVYALSVYFRLVATCTISSSRDATEFNQNNRIEGVSYK